MPLGEHLGKPLLPLNTRGLVGADHRECHLMALILGRLLVLCHFNHKILVILAPLQIDTFVVKSHRK
jgi:hypothetical protein